MAPYALSADVLGDAFPFLIGFGLFVLVPIIAMLTKHQRQMAEIVHRNREGQRTDDQVLARLDHMQRELAELRERQNETILALEDRRQPPSVQQRIEG